MGLFSYLMDGVWPGHWWGGWLEEGAGGPGAPAGPPAIDSQSNAIN